MFSHWELLHEEKAQSEVPAGCLNFPFQILLGVLNAQFDNISSICCYLFFFLNSHPMGYSVLPRTLSIRNSSQLSQQGFSIQFLLGVLQSIIYPLANCYLIFYFGLLCTQCTYSFKTICVVIIDYSLKITEYHFPLPSCS